MLHTPFWEAARGQVLALHNAPGDVSRKTTRMYNTRKVIALISHLKTPWTFTALLNGRDIGTSELKKKEHLRCCVLPFVLGFTRPNSASGAFTVDRSPPACFVSRFRTSTSVSAKTALAVSPIFLACEC